MVCGTPDCGLVRGVVARLYFHTLASLAKSRMKESQICLRALVDWAVDGIVLSRGHGKRIIANMSRPVA